MIRLTDFLPLPLPIEDEEARRSVFEWLCWVVPLLVTEAWLTWIPGIRRGLASSSRATVAASSGAGSG